MERKRGKLLGWLEQVDWVCIWAFRWVSIIRGKRMGSWPLKSIHGKGVFTVNINICVCAMARATLDKPTAVNYELACREGDRLVNMQNWRSAQTHATQVSDPHRTRSGRDWPGCQSRCTGQAIGQGLLGMNSNHCSLTEKITFLSNSSTKKLSIISPWQFFRCWKYRLEGLLQVKIGTI